MFVLNRYDSEGLVGAKGYQEEVKDEFPGEAVESDVLLEGA